MITVVAVAYGTQAPSLGVAEFAPTAREALEAPPTTAGDDGGRGAASGGRRSTTTTQPVAASASTAPGASGVTIPTTVATRVRQCFGDPAHERQLPDPRSPSCVATKFEGDNGGAMGPGASATEVRVAWITGSASDAKKRAIADVFEYFNQHFELYGRRLVPVAGLIPFTDDPAGQRANAVDIASRDVFAALEPPGENRYSAALFAELARQRVVSIALGWFSYLSDREVFDQYHPYVWSINPSVEQLWRNIADFSCTALVGRKATHAGSGLAQQTRKFGIFKTGQVRLPSVTALVDGLRACGAEPVVAETLISRDTYSGLLTAAAKLRDAGVTTVICACADDMIYYPYSRAFQVGWEPEWMLGSTGIFDEYYMQNDAKPDQAARTFGPRAYGRVMPAQQNWGWRAALEMDPTLTLNPSSQDGVFLQTVYEQLLVIAAGIQAAGPTLTPDTFAQGLMSSPFPNAEVGQAPDWSPSVGFGPGDHSFINDYSLAWWSGTAEPSGNLTTPGKGSWCYLGQGARFSVGNYPADADQRFFTEQPCR